VVKTCFLFPGQGAQYPGMAQDLWEASPGVKELFECASDTTGIDVKKLLFEGTEEELKATENTQIAITLASLSANTVLKEYEIESKGVAGFSLGEYSALTEAGVIRLEEVFPIVKARGDAMERASRRLQSRTGEPGMAAVIGLSYDKIVEIVKNASRGDVFIANYNSPTQIVLSGTAEGLNLAEQLCKDAGARRVVKLKVSAPFHSPLLEEARKEFEEVLEVYNFRDPLKSVYSNVTADLIHSGKEAKELCIKQIVSTVRWVDEEEKLIEHGYKMCLEVGPGSVLTGLWKAVGGDIKCYPAGKLEEIRMLEKE